MACSDFLFLKGVWIFNHFFFFIFFLHSTPINLRNKQGDQLHYTWGFDSLYSNMHQQTFHCTAMFWTNVLFDRHEKKKRINSNKMTTAFYD